tara:strand:+ start:109 stop:1086 length:978 start_codon:yes stop_codon:yes gene_type:complete
MANKYNLSKEYQFDIDVSAYTSYAGKLALPYVTAAVKSPDTIAKGYVRIIDGLNKSARITNLGINDPVVAAGCSFSSSNDTSLTEQVLTLTDLKVNEEICRGTVFPTWIGENMDRNGNLPGTFSDFLLASIAAKVGESLENSMWKGSAIFGTGFQSNDGTLDETGADASACKDFFEVDLDGAISTVDILTDLGAVYNSVVANASGMLSKPGFGFYMNQKTYAIYAQKLAAETTYQQVGAAGTFTGLTYMGFPIYVCPGMFNDTIIATYPENLVVGTNLATDYTEVSLIPTYQYDGSDNVRVVMNFAMGVQTAVPTDGVFATSVWS